MVFDQTSDGLLILQLFKENESEESNAYHLSERNVIVKSKVRFFQ